MSAYADFLARKTQLPDGEGFEPDALPDHLFDFQWHLTEWAVRRGRAALFVDCGLGKTPMELAWAEQVYRHTGRPVLLVTPLAVGFQMVAEAAKFGADVAISREGAVAAPITVTNYERLERFDSGAFGGVVCDESSAIKAFDGARRAIVTEFLRRMPYRLLATATAAPNDYTELGTSSEALGQLGLVDMLNRFFVNRGRTSDLRGRWSGFAAPRERQTAGWRLKGHAEQPFWRWVASWARAMRRPSDLRFSDEGFVLPPLAHDVTVVEARRPADGTLFDVPAVGLSEEREELRRTVLERCEAAANQIADVDSAVVWCNLNTESSHLSRMIEGSVEVSGSDPIDAKEEAFAAFGRGDVRVLVTKARIGGYGLNWQHCCRVVYLPSHSYEQYYQAVRRCWRYGQTRPVTVHVVTTRGGAATLSNLQRKAEQADRMFDALLAHMTDALRIKPQEFGTDVVEVPSWMR